MDIHLELLETCKLALAHVRRVEASGYTLPPLPNGQSLNDVLTAAVDKATASGYLRDPKTEEINLEDRHRALAAASVH